MSSVSAGSTAGGPRDGVEPAPQAMGTAEQAARFVARFSELNRSEPIGRRWAVERKDDGTLLGTALLVQLPEPAAGSGFPDGR